jgi:diamine N-acetyltransferase
MQDVKLSPAGEADIPEISGLARTIWYQHYPAIISGEQIAYMLDLMYSAKSLGEQLASGHKYFFVSHSGVNVGFIALEQESAGVWKLHKFYIDQLKASKGLGSKAFREIVVLLDPVKLTLTVNRQNYKSINFYFKNGFTIERVADFDIGNGYVMNDFVMVWKKASG